MKVNYFFREYNKHQISIEKLFDYIIDGVKSHAIITKKIVNPYPLSIIGILKALMFFRKNQEEINHITGDIHWVAIILSSKKTVLTIHDTVGLIQYKGIKRWLYYIIWIYLPVKKLKYITVISQKTKDEITYLIPSSEHKIKVIPNCLTIPIKSGLEENVVTERLNVLIVGTRENKNIERIFYALEDLPVNLCIIGKLNANHLHIIQKLDLSITNKIEISEEELISEYSNSNILCFTSLYEGFGLPILEAQAQNCCVITSNLSPMNQVAGEGAALFVNPFSISEIREAFLQLMNNENLRKQLIFRGKKNIENYKLDIIVQKYKNLYKEILRCY